MRPAFSFLAGCIFELAALLIAFAWSRIFHHPLFADCQLSAGSIVMGTVAAAPPLVFFIWALHSKTRLFTQHQHVLDSLVRPLFGTWSVAQFAVISAIAGVSEEALFRGAIQGSLTGHFGPTLAIVFASIAFGAAHLITWTYAIIAAVIGAYLGVLWISTANLMVPMVTHAVYDFVALIYFLRIHDSRSRPDSLSGG